jgi:hypothetical protein
VFAIDQQRWIPNIEESELDVAFDSVDDNMRRQPSSKPKGSSKIATLPQHLMAVDSTNRHQNEYINNSSGPTEMDQSRPGQPSTTSGRLSSLPSIAQLYAQPLKPPMQSLLGLPSFAQPTNLRHLLNISESDTDAEAKELRNLEDWKPYFAARDTAYDFEYDRSKLGAFAYAYDGTKLELGKADGINTYHNAKIFSIPDSLRRPNSEPFLYNQGSSETVAAKSSGNSTTANGSVTVARLVVKLRYGRRNRRRVAALLKLPDKRTISDIVHAPLQASRRLPHGVNIWSLPPYQAYKYPNDGAEYITEPSSKNDDRISPGESSNAVMMRFESNAKELDAASCAATDASHRRSISDEEEIAMAMPDTPHSDVSSEDQSPTDLPWEFFNGDKHLPTDEQLGQPTHDELDDGSEVVVPSEDPFHGSYSWTDDYSEFNVNAYPNNLDTMSMGIPEHDTTIPGIHQDELFDTTVVPAIPSSSQQMREAGSNMAQMPYQNSFTSPSISSFPGHFVPTSLFPKGERRISRQSPDEIRDYTIDPSGMVQSLNLQFRQNTTSRMGSISKDNPIVETDVNSSVDRDAQSGDHRNPFTFEAYTDSGYASNTTRALKPSEVLGQIHQTEELSADHPEIELRPVSSLDENIQLTEQEDDVASIYSDASTIPTLTKARYIDGLADDLAQAIQPYHLNDESFQQIIEKLPELLRAFALTFGHHESGTMHRDVMVFIHRYRRYVLK